MNPVGIEEKPPSHQNDTTLKPIAILSEASTTSESPVPKSTGKWLSSVEEEQKRRQELMAQTCAHYGQTVHRSLELTRQMMVDLEHKVAFCRHPKVSLECSSSLAKLCRVQCHINSTAFSPNQYSLHGAGPCKVLPMHSFFAIAISLHFHF